MEGAVAALAVIFIFYSLTRWFFVVAGRVASWLLFTPVARFSTEERISERDFKANRVIRVRSVENSTLELSPVLHIPRGYTALVVPTLKNAFPRLQTGPFELREWTTEKECEAQAGDVFGHVSFIPTTHVRVVRRRETCKKKA